MNNYPKFETKTLEELTEKNIKLIQNLEKEEKQTAPFGTHIADKIIDLVGSSASVFIHLIFFALWIIYNIFSPKPFDKFPFVLLITFVSLEAILLSIFVLINQSQSEKRNQKRNQLSLQIEILSEQENTKILTLLKSICSKLDITEEDADINLCEETDTLKIAEQIDKLSKEK